MRFTISGTMLRYTDYQKVVSIDAPTIDQALGALAEKHQALKPVLFDRLGQVRATHRLFMNGQPLERSDTQRAVGPDDAVDILTAVAGG
jgi:molybdopterin converting factor small subunit